MSSVLKVWSIVDEVDCSTGTIVRPLALQLIPNHMILQYGSHINWICIVAINSLVSFFAFQKQLFQGTCHQFDTPTKLWDLHTKVSHTLRVCYCNVLLYSLHTKVKTQPKQSLHTEIYPRQVIFFYSQLSSFVYNWDQVRYIYLFFFWPHRFYYF